MFRRHVSSVRLLHSTATTFARGKSSDNSTAWSPSREPISNTVPNVSKSTRLACRNVDNRSSISAPYALGPQSVKLYLGLASRQTGHHRPPLGVVNQTACEEACRRHDPK